MMHPMIDTRDTLDTNYAPTPLVQKVFPKGSPRHIAKHLLALWAGPRWDRELDWCFLNRSIGLSQPYL